tara:strand:- start:913 stop:1251 length:339 start_codon:yes stop_codon:yes gene_type:complete
MSEENDNTYYAVANFEYALEQLAKMATDAGVPEAQLARVEITAGPRGASAVASFPLFKKLTSGLRVYVASQDEDSRRLVVRGIGFHLYATQDVEGRMVDLDTGIESTVWSDR